MTDQFMFKYVLIFQQGLADNEYNATLAFTSEYEWIELITSELTKSEFFEFSLKIQ